MRQDWQRAVRLALKRPALTGCVVAMLALGLGANAAMFSVAQGVLLKALPYPEPDRILALRPDRQGVLSETLFGHELVNLRERTRELSSVAGFATLEAPLALRHGNELVTLAEVTGGFFEVLGVRPLLGRAIEIDDERPGSRTVVLGYALWESSYQRDPDVVGSTVIVDGQPHQVLGVMFQGFDFPEGAQCWVGLAMTPDGLRMERLPGGGDRVRPAMVRTIGRLRSGASIEQARSEASALMSRAGYPVIVSAASLQDAMVGPVRRMVWVLQGVVALLLVMVCANVAGILLALGEAGRQELTLRVVLGATRGHVLRQTLTEAALLVLLGALVGGGVAMLLVRTLRSLAPPGVPRLDDVAVDGGVLGFGIALVVTTTLACSALPAWAATASRHDMAALGQGGARFSRRGRAWVPRALAVTQVALSLVLLTASVVPLQSLWRLMRVDVGFDPTSVVAVRLTIPATTRPTTPLRLVLLDELMIGVRSLPGLDTASLVNDLPFAGGDPRVQFRPEGGEAAADQDDPIARWRIVDPGLLRTLGVQLQQGRLLDETDNAAARPVVVVNEALARRCFGGEPVLGRHLVLSDQIRREIVGVVQNTKEVTLWETDVPTIYHPLAQMGLTPQSPLPVLWLSRPMIVVKTLDAAGVARAIGHVAQRVDPLLVVDDVQTMDRRIADSISGVRFAVLVLTTIALLALITASAGLYALLTHWVTGRTHEFGVRLALGATPGRVARAVLRDGVALVVAGIVLGTAGAWQLARAVSSVAAGMDEPHWLTLLPGAFVVLAVAAAACLRPARHAAQVDPIVALRAE